MSDDPAYEKALRKAYRLLAARGRSEKELRDKLLERKVEGSVVDEVIARLYALNYLDDEAFARQWAHHLAADKSAGHRRIDRSLQEKGIDGILREQVLAEIHQEIPEREIVRQVIRKKLKGSRLQRQDLRGKRRLMQHLLGKGFASDIILDVIKEAEEGYRDDDGQ